ncbi:MAG: metal-dependent transcriptional regulator [Candidatus Dormibacteria bacterium]
MATAESQTISRYLESIYYMDAEGEHVRAARLAEWLGISQPTTGATLRRMIRDGLVTITPTREVTLTRQGRQTAERIVRRHRVAERWLTDVLGLDWVQADEEAGKLEHALSDEVAERLYQHIGRPDTCPHGNPIPGEGAVARRPERALRDLRPGKQSRVRRVSEVAEHDAPQLLRFLGESGLHLGAAVSAVEHNPGAGTVTVEVEGNRVAMSLDVAGKIWVD